MIISHINAGQKVPYSISGTTLTVGEVTIDLQQRQTTNQEVFNISLDNQLQSMRQGVGAWYVATVVIPAKKYSLQDTGEKDEEGNAVYEEVELPLDTNKVELRLWGLPAEYGKNQTVEEEGVTE